MPSCNTYRLTWVSLTLGVGYLFMASPTKKTLLLTLGEGYLLTAALPDLQRGIAPLGPPEPVQPQLRGRGVAPPGRRSWPRTWGSSSRLFLCHCSLVLLAAAPDLGHEVTPLGCRPSGMGSSRLLPLTSDVGWLLSAALVTPVAATCALVRQSQSPAY